jgi:RIO kinase 1
VQKRSFLYLKSEPSRETMRKIDTDLYLDEDFSSGPAKRIQRKNRRLGKREKQARFVADLVEHAEKVPVDVHQNFNPSFQPAEHERFWLLSYLEEFYNDQLISDVVWKVKGGKEANVYCCIAHPSTGLDLIAAKVYRPQMFRNLRNDAQYRQGREVVDQQGKVANTRREVLAVKKNTRFGQELRHASWLEAEYQTMQILYEAKADVPRPLAHGNNVILMEYIGGDRSPAPTLNQVNLDASAARRMFEKLVQDLSIMLDCHRVHADLSAYNILYWDGDFKIIDFPQAVDPRRNPDAAALFTRDVERICQYFRRYKIACDAHRLASDLWSRFQRSNALNANVTDGLFDETMGAIDT